jgi:hypothetical protein
MLVEGNLMRKNTKKELLQKYVSQGHGLKILKEIHAGTCGNHAASRTLVGKAFRAVFIGLQLSPMSRSWSVIVRGVSSSPSRLMF